MLIEPFAPYVAGAFRVKFAVEPWERAGAAGLRRRVFCEEQGLFAGDDRDATDAVAVPLVAVSSSFGMPDRVVGTVRIHEDRPGVWSGSRLAVDRTCRRVGAIGTSLIRLAVSSAHARGADRFLAHVQSGNAALFHRLHWRTIEEVELHGRPHHFMEADLARYPPYHDGETGFLTSSRAAA